MKFGIDLDNTIVDYSDVFKKIAVGLVEFSGQEFTGKESLAAHLRSINREDLWTEIQGFVYGPMMTDAKISEGLVSVLANEVKASDEIIIISHRTKFPSSGLDFDLHGGARDWINKNVISQPELSKLNLSYYFETSIEDKIKRIQSTAVDIFIDDHLGILSHTLFPSKVAKIHLSAVEGALEGILTMSSWKEFPAILRSLNLNA